MDTMGETYLREYMEHHVQSTCPRLYHNYWTACPEEDDPPNGRGIISVLAKAAKIGYKLGRDKRYKRMGAKGATGHYRRLPRPWEG